ncbi:hypothetical protein TNCV_4987331 [Trichonephila clavipes]|nr:hypothetical protein TNCV_4987331 [Trichonephila clavipes]
MTVHDKAKDEKELESHWMTVDASLFWGTWTDKQSSIPYHNVFDAGLDFVVFTQSAEWHADDWLWRWNPGGGA